MMIRSRAGARRSITSDAAAVASAKLTRGVSSTSSSSSSAAPAAAPVFSAGGADRGMERLKKSKITLDAAKVEAQRTLAPILERMKQSRRIKSAEKVLRRMSAILEYPIRMRMALDRGEYEEVVSINQRVQSMPISSNSLRILSKVKAACAVVIADLKKHCYVNLLSPSANHNALLRYGKIWMDLEGEGSYYEMLRQCLIRQVLHFTERMKEARDRFCAECADANDRAIERNLMRRSPFLFSNNNSNNNTDGGNSLAAASRSQLILTNDSSSKNHYQQQQAQHGERESLSAIVKRHHAQAASNLQQRKRYSARIRSESENSGGAACNSHNNNNTVNCGGTDSNSNALHRTWSNHTLDMDEEDEGGDDFMTMAIHSDGEGEEDDDNNNNVDYQTVKDEFAVDSDSENGDDDNWMDDDSSSEDEVDGGEDDDEYSDDGGGRSTMIDGDIDNLDFIDNHQKNRRRGDNVTTSNDQTSSSSVSASSAVAREIKYSLVLCSIVRQTYVETMVDLLAKWYPCLYRLDNIAMFLLIFYTYLNNVLI